MKKTLWYYTEIVKVLKAMNVKLDIGLKQWYYGKNYLTTPKTMEL